MKKTLKIEIDVKGESQSDISSILRRFESRLQNINIVERSGVVRVKSVKQLSDVGSESHRKRIRTFLERLG